MAVNCIQASKYEKFLLHGVPVVKSKFMSRLCIECCCWSVKSIKVNHLVCKLLHFIQTVL